MSISLSSIAGSLRSVAGAAVVTAALLAAAGSAVAGATRHVVRGKLEAVAEDGRERGRFLMGTLDRSNGGHAEHIEVFVRRLDMTVANAPVRPALRPEYRVFLIKEDGTGEADFGAMRVNRHGSGRLLFDTRRVALPAGVTTITDFGGGTMEVRRGDLAVLSGEVPYFIGINDDGGAGQATFSHDRSLLRSIDAEFAGRGEMVARRQNVPNGAKEEFRVTCRRMLNATTYTLVAISDESTETEIGSFTTSDPLGIGGLRLATANGDTIPGGGVLALAGQSVEVRDAGGVAILRGRFPTIVE